MDIPSKEELKHAIELVSMKVHRTPVLTSSSLDQIAKSHLFFKCDNFQKGGSYKIRGASYAISQLNHDQKLNGVATHSSGNFAQALSIAAKSEGIKAYIVMPEGAPKVKTDAVRSYGGEVIQCQNTLKDRETKLEEVLKETDATRIHPSNDRDVILGQATMTAELIDEIQNLDYVVCPIGGGGVGAGACLACYHLSPLTKVIGAEPANADDAFRSLKEGRIIPSINPDTIADGLRTQLGDQNFPIIQQLIDQIILVEEESIIQAMKMIWERMKIIVEPSSATTLAAILTRPEIFEGKKVGLIITGGNVSLDNLPF